ncbi:MAG: TatD family hydrolase [Flavobacteriales bacterium]|jgi:TatD DNase family protein|nr:TatD family hydrolase [Flavobacteriales bacterium]|tara:strand:- start:83 stop:859 length:777 start_codon:yes stop_codon:yes gene_type:complete
MKFIDTHTHLFLNQFDKDIDLVINNAIASGINKMFLPNISSETTNSMMELCRKYPENCFAMMGLHPCDVKKESIDKELLHVEQMLEKNKFIAVGEIGLDLYWDKTTLNIQKEAFETQIKLAKKHQLPIVIHVRESFNEAIEIVEKLNDDSLSGVFHCFTGDVGDAKKITDLENFYFGIGGVLTFKNSGLENTIKEIDIEYLILETDSPYLTPAPFRGKRNESKYIINIAEKLAEVKGVSLDKIAEITNKNASNLFKLL